MHSGVHRCGSSLGRGSLQAARAVLPRCRNVGSSSGQPGAGWDGGGRRRLCAGEHSADGRRRRRAPCSTEGQVGCVDGRQSRESTG